MSKFDVFDQTETYKSKIEPLMKKIKKLCNSHKIPFFTSFTVAADEEGKISYKRDTLTPTALKMDLDGCKIYPLICIAAGSKAVPLLEPEELEFE